MFRTGKWAAAAALVAAAVWAGFAPAAQEPRPGADDTAVDLGALRDAVDAAARRGENVDEVRKALAALERARPAANAGRVPAELRALRDAVDAAAKKGENVEAIAKELEQVEKAVAGRALTRPRPEPARPEPNPFNRRDPLPFPLPPVPDNLGGGIDVGAFQKAMDVRMRALELLKKNPRDPEARRLLNEADELMLKALLPGGRGALLPLLDVPGLPDAGRAPERPRLGVRLEKVSPIVAEQLGLDANTGIAVTGIIPGSVAERIGLRPHDIILEFAGKPVSDDADAFIRRVNEAKAGEKLDLVVLRRGKKVDVKGVTLPEAGAAPRPANPPPGPVPPVIDSPVRADAPKPAADLGDLRDAVDAANRRGENVGEIRAALAALEKALAKGAARPGEAPPELAALREAVEAAARKGENVGAVSRELGLVEKALTGREYERPRPPEPKQPDPVPPFPRRPGGGFGGRVVIGGAGGANSTSVIVSNGDFTIRSKQGDASYTITGSTDPATAPKVVIRDGDKVIETDDLKKVPEEHRAAVERLLKMVRR